MSEEQGFLATLAADPTDEETRLVYADWLEDRGHPGADYLRTELALAHAQGDEAVPLRRKLLEIIPRLPTRWRDRFEQPDLLLAPPVPFATGWYGRKARAPQPYRSLPNLDSDMLALGMPWLSGEGVRPRVDQAAFEEEELKSLAEVEARCSQLGLLLPPGFVPLARDFPRRAAVPVRGSYYEFYLHDAVIEDFPRLGDGYLILFFGDMNYGNPHQCSWCLYVVPKIDWHCVVVSELPENVDNLIPDDPGLIYYCAPSFQAFLYRWWLGERQAARR
jgi:uncharacterized protein (TIGR02996 family)